MAIRFHLDENVSGAVAIALKRRGIDVTATPDAGLIGAHDSDQIRFAMSQSRVIVTHDEDFTRLHASGSEHAGICYCAKDKYSVGELVRMLVLVDACFEAGEMHRHLEFL
jgi:predicted nuclease of predicted toxin-antitoxin system